MSGRRREYNGYRRNTGKRDHGDEVRDAVSREWAKSRRAKKLEGALAKRSL
jgi:hypothetical protein